MVILGVADNHDAAAALVVDGRLVAAASQERFDRRKNSGRFPWDAIDACLARAGLAPAEVDRVAVGTGFTPPWLVRRFPGTRRDDVVGHGQMTWLLHAYVLYQVGLQRAGLAGIETRACQRVLAPRLHARGFTRAGLAILDHHTCHAESAWRTQPRERCLVLTTDAMGDGLTATASVGGPEGLRRVASQSGLAAVNMFYSRVTEHLGFTPLRHEGKVTGLAAYAEPPEALLAHLRGKLRVEGGRFVRESYALPVDRAFYRGLDRWSREEVAAGAQRVLEEAVLAWVTHQVRQTGVSDVALAGGLYGNVKLNQRIAALPEVSSLWVFPNMGDGGLAAGAALLAAGAPPARLDHVFLGPAYGEDALADALRGLSATRPEDPVRAVADRLAAGKVAARFAGAMEYGPRALGNRSILARPDDPAINATLNTRLRRSEFMPFAPVMRAEDAPALLVGHDKAPEAARFMTVCFPATDRLRRLAPAAVHVDGTVRPQVIHERDSEMYRLLGLLGERTGSPVLVNTSFNMHEEPIVNTPHDAVRAWSDGQLDVLWMGPFLLER
ncbi:MAG: carbamoyltransferase C-terminal domain-containing protein [Myxococcota bacterium]